MSVILKAICALCSAPAEMLWKAALLVFSSFPKNGQFSDIRVHESETVTSLLNPSCDIPSDVQFELEDENGTKLGLLEGHKTVLALKSPVFKAMLFGPLREKEDPITIRNTSVTAFKILMRHIYEDIKEEEQLKIDTRDNCSADLGDR